MKTILIVDDDPINLNLAEFILKSKGNEYEVITASSGFSCLSILYKKEVDLVLLDIEMPDMDGVSTLRAMREEKAMKDIPVMFLTSVADKNTVLEAGKLGVAGYIKKPFMPQDLLDRIARNFE